MPRKSTDLAPLSDAVKDYPALRSDPGRVLAVLQENMGGEKITEFDLDRIKIPTGGSTFWEIMTIDGVMADATVEGVVVLTKNVRAYWPGAMEDGSGNDPPQCSSPDAITGEGDPGGSCDTCPYAQFGSGRPGREKGQACKQMRQLFLLTPHSMLPMVVTLPPTSLAPARKYFMRLAAQQQLYYWQMTTRLTLEKVQGEGVAYSRAVFQPGTPLTEADAAAVTAYKNALEPILARRLPSEREAAEA